MVTAGVGSLKTVIVTSGFNLNDEIVYTGFALFFYWTGRSRQGFYMAYMEG